MANLVFQAIMQYANLRKNRLPLFMVHGAHTFLYFRSEIKEQTSKERKHMLSQVYTDTFASIRKFYVVIIYFVSLRMNRLTNKYEIENG